MTVPLRNQVRLGWPTFAVLAILGCLGLLCAASAQAKSASTITLCVQKSGPEKGIVRIATGAKCKPGQQAIQVAPATQQGVLGASESSGSPAAKGDTGATGAQGAQGEKG